MRRTTRGNELMLLEGRSLIKEPTEGDEAADWAARGVLSRVYGLTGL
jgi:hypothetical protein